MKVEDEIELMKKELEIMVKLLSDMDGRIIYIKNLVERLVKENIKPKPIIDTGMIG